MQKAEAELAYELQAAKTKQRIKEEQMQIKVIERTQEILVQVIYSVLNLILAHVLPKQTDKIVFWTSISIETDLKLRKVKIFKILSKFGIKN